MYRQRMSTGVIQILCRVMLDKIYWDVGNSLRRHIFLMQNSIGGELAVRGDEVLRGNETWNRGGGANIQNLNLIKRGLHNLIQGT